MCVSGPPSASAVICSPVTCLMTCGPVMNIWAWPRLDDEVGQRRGVGGARRRTARR